MIKECQARLLLAAKSAAELSYSQYSKFRVGAAVYANGEIFLGTNIENASSNLGICAERVAISHARIHGAFNIQGIAVFCIDAKPNESGKIKESLCLPCGGCLQWIAELAPAAWIVTNSSNRQFTLSDLLPKPFLLSSIGNVKNTAVI